MALGSVTLIKKGVIAPGGLRYVILEVQPTSGANYTANGEALPLSNFRKFDNGVLWSSATPKDEASSATSVFVDNSTPASPKLVAIDAATGVEEAAAQDLSAMRFRIFAIGT